MAILKVARIGNPVVRAVARPVPESQIRSAAMQRLIDDMIETMHEYDGVGLAAPQVHVSLRLAVIEVPAGDDRGEGGVPLQVLVNPVVTPIGQELVTAWEGCLSVPDLRGQVPRASQVRLAALDRQGRPFQAEAGDLFARVIQHECDHLDGHVYLDRMTDLTSLSFLPEFERYAQAESDEDEA